MDHSKDPAAQSSPAGGEVVMRKMDKKICIIFMICTGLVIGCIIWTLVRSYIPSWGKPYERLSAMEAREYMSYEADYCIVDVRDPASFEKGHVSGAVNLPYERIVEDADDVITNRGQMVYVYGEDSDQSCAAAQKLCDIGFLSITETGSYEDWLHPETESQSGE